MSFYKLLTCEPPLKENIPKSNINTISYKPIESITSNRIEYKNTKNLTINKLLFNKSHKSSTQEITLNNNTIHKPSFTNNIINDDKSLLIKPEIYKALLIYYYLEFKLLFYTTIFQQYNHFISKISYIELQNIKNILKVKYNRFKLYTYIYLRIHSKSTTNISSNIIELVQDTNLVLKNPVYNIILDKYAILHSDTASIPKYHNSKLQFNNISQELKLNKNVINMLDNPENYTNENLPYLISKQLLPYSEYNSKYNTYSFNLLIECKEPKGDINETYLQEAINTLLNYLKSILLLIVNTIPADKLYKITSELNKIFTFDILTPEDISHITPIFNKYKVNKLIPSNKFL